ncbi:hypothetical protein OPQ81_000731 [Rhizoctonia solani]|nr:hypothetical protein OPQ81_000731 [Rhizoctonia solani]
MSQPPGTTGDPSGINYLERFRRSGDPNDLDKAIEYMKQAIIPKPDDPYLLGPLGGSYYIRFKRQKSLSDLDRAIEHFTRALSHPPEVESDVYELLTTLSVCHHQRFHLLGEGRDLDKDIQYKGRAVLMGSYISPFVLIGLGRAYRVRFQRLGDLDDLEQSIDYCIRAGSGMANNDLDLASCLDSLGDSYLLHSERLDDPSEMDIAIEHQTRAASLTPQEHPMFMQRLNNLAASFNMRYNRLGDPNDLEKSIEYSLHALSFTSTDHSLRVRVLINLSILQLLRFLRDKDLQDLEKGINYNDDAFSLTAGNHSDEAFRLKYRGELLYARFNNLHDVPDLDLAIESISRAVSLLHDGDEDLGDQLDHLGGYVHARWHLLHNLEDLDKDIEYKSRAVNLTPKHHNRLSRRIESLGRSYLCKSLSDHPCDHQQMLHLAIDCFRQATFAEFNPPIVKFQSACIWARSSLRLSLTESLEAYGVAIDLIPQVIWLGTTISQRYHDIKDLSNIVGEAASIAIKAGDYKRALEWLEQGRSIVMNQSMMLRSPLDDLRSVEPTLAEKLQKVAMELHSVASRDQIHYDMVLSNISLNNPEKLADRHRQLVKEHADLLSRVRQLPGFEGFLKPKQASELVSAARTGPVVIVNIFIPSNPPEILEYSCDALILRPGTPEIAHLPLLKFNSRTSANIYSRFDSLMLRGSPIERGIRIRPRADQGSDFANILAALWNGIVKPVIDFLGYKPMKPLDELPHITWCTGGSISALPLHAAGTYGTSKICASDYAISSYTPSLTALLSSPLNPKVTSIVAIAQVQTPGSHNSLPGAARELEYIQEHASNMIPYTQLTNQQATIEAVLDAMERYDCVHLACHAHQSINDPVKSGFFLHDGTLDLISIMRRSFRNKGLAFLSACQTAMGDKELPNETAHLASSMLIAGYPSVIATMWSVWDKDAPFVADRFYGQILKDDGMHCQDSAKALHYAIWALRKEIGDDRFERWVPFIHIGM